MASSSCTSAGVPERLVQLVHDELYSKMLPPLRLVDPPHEYKTAWPISEFGYALVPANGKQATVVQQFLTYCVTTGRSLGTLIDFPPIPIVVQAAALRTINGLS
ncbi:MAG TPA: hypothetical protein VME46_19430 [Acidimicrobiales bacterium]|nr:hypothetical protein [Acidimicrobiales bacterium]